MANRFALSGNTSSTSTWATTSGGAPGASVPVAADTIILDANSGNLTVDVALSCTGFSAVAYTGIMNWLAGITCSSTYVWTNGTMITNGWPLTCTIFQSSNSNTRAIDWGSTPSTVTVTATTASTVFNITTTTGLTMTGVPNVVISTASASTRTVAGGGKTLSLTYTVAGSTGSLVVTGSNFWDAFNFSDATNARTVSFTIGTTQTFNNIPAILGTSGKLMTINSTSAGTAASLSYLGSGVISLDYLSVKDSTPVQTNKFYAGQNSTLVSNTGNWILGKGNAQSFTAGIGFNAVGPKQTNVPLSAGMTLAGSAFRKAIPSLSSVLNFSGSLSRRAAYQRILTATLNATGGMTKLVTAPFFAGLSFAGQSLRQSAHGLYSALTFTGDHAERKQFGRILTATLGFAQTEESTLGGIGAGGFGDGDFGEGNVGNRFDIGNLIVDYIKSKGLYFTGQLYFVLNKRISSNLTFSGALPRRFSRILRSAVSFTTLFLNPLLRFYTGAVGFVSNLTTFLRHPKNQKPRMVSPDLENSKARITINKRH